MQSLKWADLVTTCEKCRGDGGKRFHYANGKPEGVTLDEHNRLVCAKCGTSPYTLTAEGAVLRDFIRLVIGKNL